MTKVAGSSGFVASTDAGGYKVPIVPASANGAGKVGAGSSSVATNGSRPPPNHTAAVVGANTTAATIAPATAFSASDLVRYSTLFEPKSARSWEKSRKIENDKNAAVTVIPTQDGLDLQLRPEEEGLVPLQAIAGRMVQYAWQLFANQVEINPSISPLARRKRIYEDAHEARRQLIKLLVLVQWSQSAPELQVARSLIALINDHIVQSNVAIESIAETRSMLSNAHLRNYDLVTAIEVLSRGRPQTIPASFKEFVRPQRSYTDSEALALVSKLDDILRLRLASEEMLAMPMLSYCINDGRACFTADQLFEADLTLSGSYPDDRWWLLRVKFDFRITGGGADRFPRQLRGQQRLNLLELADSELAPRSVATAATEREAGESVAEMVGAVDSEVEDRSEAVVGGSSASLGLRRDAPLVRLYNLLQSQSLHYRLDILHWQAVQMMKLSWHQRLVVFFDASRVLHLRYWRKTHELQDGTGDDWDPCPQADICISVSESEQRQGAVGMIKSMFEKFDDRGHKPAILEVAAHWEVQGVANEFLDSREVHVDHHALDAQTLLLNVVQRHAKAAILAFRARIEASALSKTMKLDVRSRSIDSMEEHILLITVHERLTVQLSIDKMSGQVKLEEQASVTPSLSNDALSCATLASLTRLNYVRDASKAINERPRMVVAVLQRLRCQILLDDLEEKCALAGLPCTKRMPLRQMDYAQLQAVPGTLLFVSMQQCPSYYLVLHVGDDSIRVALMCAGTFLEDTITSVRIVSLERLDWMLVLRSCPQFGPRRGKRKRDADKETSNCDGDGSTVTMSEDDLAALHSYSVALICYHKIEEQLRQRGISFIHVGGLTGRQVHDTAVNRSESLVNGVRQHSADGSVSPIIPSLCIDSHALMGSTKGNLTSRNVLLRLHRWTDRRRCRVEMALKINLRSDIVTRNRIVDGADEVIYNAQTGVLTFAIADIENCFVHFLTSWRRIEKVLELVKVLWRQQRQRAKTLHNLTVRSAVYALDAFDMTHVGFQYAEGMSAKVAWIQDLRKTKHGYFALAFSTATKMTKEDAGIQLPPNPHNVMRQALQRALNCGDESKPSFWPAFLNLLQRTLPIAQAVYDLPDQCLQDVRVPELEVKSSDWVRLTFLNRFTLDARLLSGDRALFHDASQSASLYSEEEQAHDKVHLSKEDVEDTPLSQDDPFALSMLQPSERVAKASSLRKFDDWHAIPSFSKIVRDIADDLPLHVNDAGKQANYITMTFSNALVYQGDSGAVQWILRQLIDRITSALD